MDGMTQRVGTALAALATVALLLLSGAANAQDFVGVRAMSLGEAYRAVDASNDGIYTNPATLLALRRYSPELHYTAHVKPGGDAYHVFDASVVDSRSPSGVAAGIAYTFEGGERTQRASQAHKATLAIAIPLLGNAAGIGGGFKYVNVNDAVVGNYLNALTADIGGWLRLPGGVSLGAVGYNLWPIQSAAVPLSSGFGLAWDLGPVSAAIFGGAPGVGGLSPAGVPRTGPIGMRGPLDGLVLSMDWATEWATIYGPQHRVSAGLEYLAFAMVPVRLGYKWDQAPDLLVPGRAPELQGAHEASAGIGFVAAAVAVDVGGKIDVNDPGRWTAGLALKFFTP